MMIPQEATIVSNYLTLSSMGLMDTFFSVVCTSIVSVFGVFLLRQFYMTIPDALLEAAKIDGAGEIQSFISIILPLGKSAMATIAIIGFIGNWNSYLWPLIDGERTVMELAALQKEHFGEAAEPLYPRIVKYFQILESYHFISFKNMEK